MNRPNLLSEPASGETLEECWTRRGFERAALVLSALFVWGIGTSVLGAASFEVPPVLRASDLVEPEILSGPYHKVDEEVRNDGALNHFTIRSDFGVFEAESERMLRVRVREIGAIAKLREISRSESFAEALGGAALKPIKAVEQVVTKPEETLKGLPKGISRTFRGLYYRGRKAVNEIEKSRTQDGENEAAGTSQGANSGSEKAVEASTEAAKSYFRYNSARRKLARDLQIDPYSTNAVLQQELTRLAQAVFAGGLAFNLAVPQVSALGYIGDVSDLVWNVSATELERRNDKALNGLGVKKDVRLDLFENPNWTLTLETILTESLKHLAPARQRHRLVELAATADSPQAARFFAEASRLLSLYHQRRRPLTEIQILDDENGKLLFGLAQGQTLVVPAPVDYLIWQEGMSDDPLASYEGSRELWITGRISNRARSEIVSQGWAVHTQALLELAPEVEAGSSN